MCNLYRMTKTVDEVAQLFKVRRVPGINVSAETYPGTPGLVIAEGQARSMIWGFPLSLKGKSGQPLKPKPVNNARTDKLQGGFWRDSFERRRCLILMTGFAEAEGPKGGKSRTWISVADQPVFACAGIWRDSAEWGAVYSMVMTQANEAMKPIHDRMPVILSPNDHACWLAGPSSDAFDLCQPYRDTLSIDRTDQPWTSR